MELYPAIDIRGGKCVRLRQGDYNAETVYGADPIEQAWEFVTAGASWLHVVDLDAARSGIASNREVVAAIAQAVPVPVQSGGGVRNEMAAQALFDVGVERVVIGTAALKTPELVVALAQNNRIAVGLDSRAGEVATDGWLVGSGRDTADVARAFSGSGVDAFVVTDIVRDGTLGGPDLAGLQEMLAVTDKDVIASGGVGSLDDLRALAGIEAHGHRLSGVIAGKALYEGQFDVAAALSVLSE
ncbi:MAG: 1-(5-phosphoribosyl)-5-[(5-phosphoribosylamino)methylideneamino]imidazole-4-carboxamide isomerase [Acidimicrobiia bacterium]|nr:1-(5-phosphoribosyl)-5-[(5-phosphoribosylamino)methylideneamino]imidazole-4-carboxamide isomerase [Acidimicrobiia bacterium]